MASPGPQPYFGLDTPTPRSSPLSERTSGQAPAWIPIRDPHQRDSPSPPGMCVKSRNSPQLGLTLEGALKQTQWQGESFWESQPLP